MSDKVLVAMPCGGPVEPRTVQSAMNLVSHAAIKGVNIGAVGITDRTLIHVARNQISVEFLASDAEWIFWMDSDMILEARTIPTMIQWAVDLDAKMLTGIYCQRLGEHKPVIGIHGAKDIDTGQVCLLADEYATVNIAPKDWNIPPFQVDSAGFGCMLIHRSVYTGMKYPFFRFLFLDNSREKKTDSYISEDFYFCRQARKLGHKIWAIPELKCGHLGMAPVITKDDYKPDLSRVINVRAFNGKEQEVAK